MLDSGECLTVDEIDELDALLRQASARHSHLCPRQVIGVRAGLLAARLFGMQLPRDDKRLFAFVETDGCFVDGVSVATGCSMGKRTMRLVDLGKVGVTFVDTHGGMAVRVRPNPTARDRAWHYAPNAPDSWHAQLEGYKIMPTCELLLFERVRLLVSMESLISKPGLRAVCSVCGEEIMNEREVCAESANGTGEPSIMCKHCAGLDTYYQTENP